VPYFTALRRASALLRQQLSFLRRLLGVNRALLWAGGARGLAIVLGPIGSIITVYTLSATEQGTYYLFMSLVSLISLFDLGASAAIAQMTPHEIDDESALFALPRADFVIVALQWMNRIALAFGLVIGPVGALLLTSAKQYDVAVHAMWIATVIAAAITGALEGRLKIVYGAGGVDWTNRLRFLSVMIQYPVQWLMLVSGASLFSFSASLFAVYIFQRWQLHQTYPDLWPAQSPSTPERERIQRELLALIGRASLTYASGVLVLHVQQPLVYHLLGPSESAKFGLTAMVGSSLINLASLWGMTDFPSIARQVKQGALPDAFKGFRQMLARTALVATIGLAAGLAAIPVLRLLTRFSERLLTVPNAIPLFAALWLQVVALSWTYWPRAFKAEPFTPVAATQMIVTPIAVWFFCTTFGITGVGVANLLSWIVGMIGIVLITRRYNSPAEIAIKSAEV